jgi:hypothetical protein
LNLVDNYNRMYAIAYNYRIKHLKLNVTRFNDQ